MTIPENYRKPILFAVIFHVIILCVLIFSLAPSMFRMPPSSAPMKTVHATAVTEASVQEAVHQAEHNPDIQKIEEEKKLAQIKMERQLTQERERADKIKQAAIAEKKALILEQNKMALLKVQAEKTAEKKAQKKAQENAEKLAKIKKAQQLKKQQAALAKKQQAEKLIAEQKKLQQELMQQQMANEQKNISTVISQAQQGAIDKYKAEILSAIQSNWRIDQINAKLKCIYSVQLAPDGTVLAIQLVKSSGDSALDQSAQQAITLASPLPVPHNPVLFNHFRQLVLTLSPQGVLQSVGTA